MAITHDFTIEQGATFAGLTFGQETEDGDAVPFADGSTARLQIRKTVKAAETLLDVVPTVDADAGTVSFTLTAAQTSAIPNGAFPYQVEVYAGADATHEPVIRLAQGTVTVDPEVVR